ncbi:DUF58 domain-containing protein [Janthinobacterium sp. B9-8]|uniref:DUF58 domain-containing protein n=1 Tax=Janthinobacterium sp. B9-8 TaxID=1236179 RepID=UPI00069B7F51|nr:DUF58 domain-containing protein [Janthinobacterium sp. B9-8]AMC33963.1 hypothetical protein VN23_04785 [Janthinobacterium sp. B9-8]
MLNQLKQRWLQHWFAKRHPTQSSVMTLKYDRIYILPSGFGYAFCFTALLILIGAINYQLSLAYLFAFSLLGLGHAVLLRTFRNLLKLRLQLFDAPAVFAGEIASFPLHISHGSKLIRHAILFQFKNQPTVSANLIEHEVELAVPLLSQQRGWLNAPTLHLSSRYPVGWCHAWSYLNSPARCLIWPCPENDPPPWQIDHDQGNTIGRGEEDFAGIRPYQQGDSLRRIAWKHAAHSESLPVKFFDSQGASAQVFSWNQLSGLDSEARLSRLAAWILAAQQLGTPYGLSLPTQSIEPALGEAHQINCLNALALFNH